MDTRFYLIENMMGFENPVEEGSLEDLEIKKEEYERKPRSKQVGSGASTFVVEASYDIVLKEEWDTHHCPLIAVDHY